MTAPATAARRPIRAAISPPQPTSSRASPMRWVSIASRSWDTPVEAPMPSPAARCFRIAFSPSSAWPDSPPLVPRASTGSPAWRSPASSRCARPPPAVRRRRATRPRALQYDPEFTPADEAALAGPWSWLEGVVGPAIAHGPGGLIDDDLAYIAPWGSEPGRSRHRPCCCTALAIGSCRALTASGSRAAAPRQSCVSIRTTGTSGSSRPASRHWNGSWSVPSETESVAVHGAVELAIWNG